MGILEGMVAGAGEALQNVGLQGVAAAIQAERDARLSELRLSEEATIRQRGKDDAAAERTRVETEAADIASRRKVTPPDVEAQTDASAIALHSAQAAGTLPPGALETGLIGLSKYATDRAVPDARPTARDRMQAQGKHTEVANLQEKDVDNARADDAQMTASENTRLDNLRADRQLAVSEGNLERANMLADKQLEMTQLQIDQARDAGKIPAAVALQIKTKQSELDGVIRDINAARKTGMPVDKAALDEKAVLVDEITRLITPYMPKGDGAATTPAAAATYEYRDGKLVKAGSAAAAPKPGLIAERPVAPTSADYSASEKAAAERKEKLEKERAERMEKQKKRGEEIDRFNATMKK